MRRLIKMNEELLTAYHEAGHARVAEDVHSGCVTAVRIYDEHGAPQGDTAIVPAIYDAFDDVQRAAIALAGMLTEALAWSRRTDPAASIVSGPGLKEEILRVIGVIEQSGLLEDKVKVPTSFLPGVPQMRLGKLTAKDIESISDAVREDDKLMTKAVRLALQTINIAGEWPSFRDTARELVRIKPNPITNYTMFLAGLNDA